MRYSYKIKIKIYLIIFRLLPPLIIALFLNKNIIAIIAIKINNIMDAIIIKIISRKEYLSNFIYSLQYFPFKGIS